MLGSILISFLVLYTYIFCNVFWIAVIDFDVFILFTYLNSIVITANTIKIIRYN